MTGFILDQNSLGLILSAVVILVALASFLVIFTCMVYLYRENTRLQKRLLQQVARESQRLLPVVDILNETEPVEGELVAQFKMKLGKQVVSVLEADGKRYVRIKGKMSNGERARMLEYLKSEGFML